MSDTVLQKNLYKFIKERNIQITELERKAELKKNSVYNIIKGISRKPSAEILQTIADTLGVLIKDLYNPNIKVNDYLGQDDYILFQKILPEIIKTIKKLNLVVSETEFSQTLNEVFNYYRPTPDESIDNKIIEWILHQRVQEKYSI
ncbi:transcriptional regulator [Rickettsia sp. MEAM1 (Bemisia tabaci)]|uniref:helix-turn-helix domain-containing protein n=1 Tax=unclassified Rickettsia TaxID=114295 RepID=UPI00082B3700|nr:MULTISPECIES: helix-turn-helix transcriptional regulator [unclassified Rickettsia]ASX28171.1 transcriptional regulator [Rickettsia sp. MEAM1 (Bemisia tabaci)]ODA37240.1 transcriptional regulator [Rickettsia sp. wb]ODA38065.1 transcriptional regulator [Rickettsia sp. wq]